MRRPAIYTTTTIKGWEEDACYDGRHWVPARPMDSPCHHNLGVFQRFRIAWRVFVGKLDALDWMEGQDNG